MKPFVTAIIRLFAGEDLEPEFPSSHATESAPQPQEPPRLVIEVMRRMPKPSLRTLIGLAVVAAGIAL
jgi:protease I